MKTGTKSKAIKKTKINLPKKIVYFFGGGKAEGNESMKNILGGKGANLAEMAGHPDLRLPVPPGFTITTDVCTYYWANNMQYPPQLKADVEKYLKKVEELTGKRFGDPSNPLLVSVRSGARKSMPGMMETILNVGLTTKTIPGLIELTQNPRFVWDAYRRLIMMYADVVMEKSWKVIDIARKYKTTNSEEILKKLKEIESDDEVGIRKQLDMMMDEMKKKKGVENDTDLTADDLKELSQRFKERVKEVIGKEFPDDPWEQLWGAIGAVFASWNGKRAIEYRKIEGIPDDWGTAVNVQTMVFGNMGNDSATGVAFTRNPATGENKFYGEFLINAQGEDVVAGIRTPYPINEDSKNEHSKNLPTLQEMMPEVYKELLDIRKRLEKHYRDMLDIEFTIEKGKLYMLQCRVGKRNGPAAVKMALDMYKEKLITKEEAVMRVSPSQLNELLHPSIDPNDEKNYKPIAKGLPAGPGGAVGRIVFTANDAVEWTKRGEKVILVREETNPEDIEGMRAAVAILTARGGMTSHAALVARGWGKCCVVGAEAIQIDLKNRQMSVNGKTYKEGDWITVNGTKGLVYEGKLKMVDAGSANKCLMDFLKLAKSLKKLGVWTNADTPEDAKKAREFGAEGIGLFRIEHMFYGEGSDEPLFKLRKMIVSKTKEERIAALNELFPYMKEDIKKTLEVMQGLPVTIRLIDPPLHEFVPHDEEKLKALANELGITFEELKARAESLRESNPMMGHRGVRLGITYPEITEMQIRAIFEAAAELIKKGIKAKPEIMIPVVSHEKEVEFIIPIIKNVYDEVIKKHRIKKIDYKIGTMIEIPRACLVAGKLAKTMEFFSFGTNDLTQMGFGFSRDDSGVFIKDYVEKKILDEDPFQTIDQEGIGELIKITVERGRKVRKDLKVGICGEQGGEPKSVEFCHNVGLTYVSCSPFRLPIAILAAAQANIKSKQKK